MYANFFKYFKKNLKINLILGGISCGKSLISNYFISQYKVKILIKYNILFIIATID